MKRKGMEASGLMGQWGNGRMVERGLLGWEGGAVKFNLGNDEELWSLGFGPDRYRSYRIALGSFRESEVILRIACVNDERLTALTQKLGGYLSNLCNSTK